MQPSLNQVQIDDVVAIAESFEASSAELYRQAAADSDRPEVRQALLGLAEMEDQHLQAFTALRRRLAGRPQLAGHGVRQAELLEAWLAREVFAAGAPPPDEAQRANTVESWIETAVGMEKESIAFYSGMRTLVAEDYRTVLDGIIDEEVYHLASLSYLLQTLRRGQGQGPPA